MKSSAIKSAMLSIFLLLGAAICGAATLTVGPGKQYATPCPAIKAAASGDTITIDYNSGIPYTELADPTHGNRSDCVWFTNNLTIVGVNGRPVLDAAGETIQKGIFNPYGANNVISNLEFRNTATPGGQGDNGAGIRVDSGSTASPAGGNITVQFCYIHDNEDGILTANVGGSTGGAYLSANPYVTFLNDEFAYNGTNGSGLTHNMYIGYDGGRTVGRRRGSPGACSSRGGGGRGGRRSRSCRCRGRRCGNCDRHSRCRRANADHQRCTRDDRHNSILWIHKRPIVYSRSNSRM